ncbi:2,3-bisphosphoglycerate-independent phosphoglycerate mutase [Legionella oakridgensis]|uniref:2,3-bisphosphoglycerate-independent phosphoglycerate mutase n=1 Tax=Legionella oakridgensis TaxID=29423 RepID=UPI0003DDF8A6|nr:2,3-bisphosphoglycerate-independent phosphoglycerate mutase [Legionella oakridgensis]ETO92521.1 phosphoglycerate mutase [Legionella oakridgensis RV-2-2007]
MLAKKPIVLLILDGWGVREDSQYNAIAAAHTPQWDAWWQTCPHIMLDASGSSVGLPDAQMGNSEVGHMHIGAGRIIAQDYTRINQAIEQNEYDKNEIFIEVIDAMKKQGKALHVLGLLSPGGVHSHEQHLFAFLGLCAKRQFTNVYLHLFLDGRDTPPQSAHLSLEKLQNCLKKYPVAVISSLSGRYYAMDRDQRWQRIEPVYQLLTENASSHHYATADAALTAFYQQKIYDEFIPPARIGTGKAIESGDSVFFFNFRADRARQLTHALTDREFSGFNRHKIPDIAYFITMTNYGNNIRARSAFPPISMNNTLGEVLANHGLRQLRLAETEKYAHVTFFFNGGCEPPYANEDRILIPSPLVATYDLKPEMSAPELTKTLVDAIQQQVYDVIICNYANADMVGHSGNFAATVKAIEYLDKAMHTIGEALNKVGGQLLVTADHGNAEIMYDETTQQVQTAHTNQPVPLLYVGHGWTFKTQKGSLIDIAPTLLALLGIKPPVEMTGTVLLAKNHDASN